MNTSWWNFGEYRGFPGKELDNNILVCPFCETKGNFERVFHCHNTKPNGKKSLNYEVYQCKACTNHVLVFWSANENKTLPRYSFLMLPYQKDDFAPNTEWPEGIQKTWSDLKKCMQNELYEPAAMTARSLLQRIFRDMGSTEEKLVKAIDKLCEERKLSEAMKDWAHELRLLGNKAAHAKPDTEIDPQDVKDVVSYIDFLLEYLYTLPIRITQYRSRIE